MRVALAPGCMLDIGLWNPRQKVYLDYEELLSRHETKPTRLRPRMPEAKDDVMTRLSGYLRCWGGGETGGPFPLPIEE